MSGGQTKVQFRPRLEGLLNAAAKRKKKSVSEVVRMIVEEGSDRLEGGRTNLLNESILGRTLATRFNLEEMSARSFDPTSDESISGKIRVNALDSHGRYACF
jgi:hypothetical protein